MSVSGIATATTALRRSWLWSPLRQHSRYNYAPSNHAANMVVFDFQPFLLRFRWKKHHDHHYHHQKQQQQPSGILVQVSTTAAEVRRFFHSSLVNQKLSNDEDDNDNNDRLSIPTKRLEDANPERIHGIQVNPDSLGYHILPGNLIYKTYRWTGNVRKIPVELARGYFWMVRDLRATDSKPTLSNATIIPEQDAQTFPDTLTGVQQLLSGGSENSSTVDLPWFFLHDGDDDSVNPKPKLTLLAISFRDNGYKMIPSWTQPFQEYNNNNNILQTYTLSITEHWVLYPFQSLLQRVMRQNTPLADHATTLVKFGSGKKGELDDVRDILRMHNIMTAYVFLLDDLGRVRFAGSGPATDQDMEHLQHCIDQLREEILPQSYNYNGSSNSSSSRSSNIKKKKR